VRQEILDTFRRNIESCFDCGGGKRKLLLD
jgi:hypothetical protein